MVGKQAQGPSGALVKPRASAAGSLKIGVGSSHVKRVVDREAEISPVAETGGGGWTCGARARPHYRERLRNLEFLAHIRTAACGVASTCRALLRRQRQQLACAPRATSRRRGGAKQTALAPSEGPALEEPRVPRAKYQRAVCASSSTDEKGRQRQQPARAPRAMSRWRRGATKQIALAPRDGLALEEPRVPRAKPDGRVCVVRGQRGTTTTAAARAVSRWRLAEAPTKQPLHLAKGWRKGGPFSTAPRAHQGGRVRRGVLLPASRRRQSSVIKRQQLARHKRQQ